MRQYELMIILDPSLSKDELNKLLEDIKTDLGEAKCTLVSEDVWGVRPMAYTIHRSDEGYYIIYTLDMVDPRRLLEITPILNIKKGLWRHLFTLLPNKPA